MDYETARWLYLQPGNERIQKEVPKPLPLLRRYSAGSTSPQPANCTVHRRS